MMVTAQLSCPNCGNLLIQTQGEWRCPVGYAKCVRATQPRDVMHRNPCPGCGEIMREKHVCKRIPKDAPSQAKDAPVPDRVPGVREDAPTVSQPAAPVREVSPAGELCPFGCGGKWHQHHKCNDESY